MTFKDMNPYDIYEMALERPAINYFICYTFNNHQTYEKGWAIGERGKVDIAVLLRKTKLIQVLYDPHVNPMDYAVALSQLLSETDWLKAVVTKPVMEAITSASKVSEISKGAIIAACDVSEYKAGITKSDGLKDRRMRDDEAYTLKALDEHGIACVLPLYTEVFKGFASLAYMKEKLASGRGRALGLFRGEELISVAQTDYETETSAIIVGVATRKAYQGKGLGRYCFESLCEALVSEGKSLYLQFDDPIAGNLYESVGFQAIEHIYTLMK